jgi:hypothetical protein
MHCSWNIQDIWEDMKNLHLNDIQVTHFLYYNLKRCATECSQSTAQINR